MSVRGQEASPDDPRATGVPDLADYYALVYHLAKQMHRRLQHNGVAIEFDDLVQEGMVGLVQAAQSFEPQAGVKFSTFAYPRITGAIKDSLRRRDPLSQERRQAVRELDQAKARVSQAKGRAPMRWELAAILDVAAHELDHLEALAAPGGVQPSARSEQASIVWLEVPPFGGWLGAFGRYLPSGAVVGGS